MVGEERALLARELGDSAEVSLFELTCEYQALRDELVSPEAREYAGELQDGAERRLARPATLWFDNATGIER